MRPYFYMLSYAFFQTTVWLFVAYLSHNIPITVMFLFRNLLGFLVSFLRHSTSGLNMGTCKRWKMHLLRAAASLCGGMSIFYSITLIPVADAVAITFLAPIFGTLASALFLGEKLSKTIVIKLVVGFTGVYLITGFSADGTWQGYAASILGALTSGIAYMSVKSLSETEKTNDIVFVSYLLMVPIATLIAIPNWITPTFIELTLLIALGLSFYIAQVMLASALSLAPASKVLPFDYSRILFSSVLGAIFLSQHVSINTYLGALIILAVSLIRERKK
jgi:drug/metabolite transporter (DMT)-like permease